MSGLRVIVLDSTPLGLLMTPIGHRQGDECRNWLETQLRNSVKVFVPAIVVYELRRELLRLQNFKALTVLENFLREPADRYLLLSDQQLHHAAELWAQARMRGKPTSDAAALDVDVILAAQTLSLKLQDDEYVVATSNVGHLSQFVPARDWREI